MSNLGDIPANTPVRTTAEADAAYAAIAHATTHKSGGSDAIKLDELAAPTDITTLDASLTAHGLMMKYPGGTTNFLRADGTFAAIPAGGSPPTGTGFRHITGGVEDAAAKLVDTADINDNQVTFAKLQDISATARILGRITAGAGDAEELTGTQATTLLDAFTSTLKGLTPASGGGTTNFLRADGSFAAPPDTGITQLTSDVTAGPGSGSQAATIAANAVTYAKMQDITAASKLLGRGSAGGAGDPEEITLGTNLSMSGTTLNAAAGAGGSTYTDFTKDLGIGARSGTFDITGLSGLTADKVVNVMQTAAAIASKGNARDEPEMDLIRLTGYVVDATTIRCYWSSPGVVVGTYNFAYFVSG